MLIKYVRNRKENWDEFIDTCVFVYNTSRHESTTFTPFEVMFERHAYLPIDVDSEKGTSDELLKKWQEVANNTSMEG